MYDQLARSEWKLVYTFSVISRDIRLAPLILTHRFEKAGRVAVSVEAVFTYQSTAAIFKGLLIRYGSVHLKDASVTYIT